MHSVEEEQRVTTAKFYGATLDFIFLTPAGRLSRELDRSISPSRPIARKPERELSLRVIFTGLALGDGRVERVIGPAR